MINPAFKLHELLNEAYSRCGNKLTPPGYKTTWSAVFGIDEEDTSSLLKSMISMINLLNSTKEYVIHDTMSYDDTDVLFLNRIENAISYMDFEGNMSHFSRSIDQETLTALRYMGKNINYVYKFSDQPIIIEEEIKDLIDEVENLIDSITDSVLKDEVKILLLKNLNIIRESLFTYRISGAEAMKAALEQTIGSLFINNEIIVSVEQSEEVSRTFKVIDKLNTILSTGVAAKDLIGSISKLLLRQ